MRLVVVVLCCVLDGWMDGIWWCFWLWLLFDMGRSYIICMVCALLCSAEPAGRSVWPRPRVRLIGGWILNWWTER